MTSEVKVAERKSNEGKFDGNFLNKVWRLDSRKWCFYHLNKSIARCASPPTWQVLLLEVPFILLIQKEKAFSVWFSSPQPPPHYFHASPPTCQVLLLDLPFILLIWKEIALSFYSPPTPPPFPSPTTHLSSLPYEKRIINQPNAISLLIVNWSDCWPCFLWFNLKT